MAKKKPQPPADPVKKPGDLAHGVQRERGVPQVEKVEEDQTHHPSEAQPASDATTTPQSPLTPQPDDPRTEPPEE